MIDAKTPGYVRQINSRIGWLGSSASEPPEITGLWGRRPTLRVGARPPQPPEIAFAARSLAAVVLCLLIASPGSAGEPFGVSLMRPDSLAGWDHGDRPPADWTIADGRLSGNSSSSPLLSGWTFGDFELRFQWSVADGGAWKISLPEVPSGKGLQLILREGDGCGQLQDGDNTLAPGGNIDPLEGKMHTATVRRAGRKFSLMVDGRQLCQADVKPNRRFGLALAVTDGSATLADLRLQEPPGKPIFNGKNLQGWWTPGEINAWRVENGQITLSQRGGNYIRTKKQYANFTLYVEYKIAKGGNSGIGIRTPRDGWPSGDGLELQLWDKPYDRELDKHQTMAIYGNVPPLARADKSEQWNRVVIKADGWMVSAWVNGELCQQYNAYGHPELKHRNPAGWIGFQDHKDGVQFRDIRVLEAPPGTGLAAWLKPQPLRGCTAVLDRLMNPERLSLDHGIRSGVAAKTISGGKDDQHLLAELTGPGAVVRIASSGRQGRLAFYFDGENRPRIDCKPDELAQAVPHLCDNRNPVLTFLAYQKSLKVVLRSAESAEYRLDYLTLPEDLPVETYTDPKSGFPRGWLSAVVYRTLRCKTGRHREYDPMPRLESKKYTVKPDNSRRLFHLEGAGIVRWVKLQADKKVLDDNDLWLEVTIDGEDTPAVSAPARYWFPGLAGQQNFYNFVMFQREGFANILAMPYAHGFTVCAKNCGKQPIEDVGVQLYFEPATEQTRDEIAKRMRLRGVFQPAQEGTNELVHQEGSGRWVAFVYQQPKGSESGIDSLVLDGKPVQGWSNPDLDLFLGQRSDDFRTALSGRHRGLCWRYLMLAPVDFQSSLVLKTTGNQVSDRLALFYMKK